MPVHGGPSDFRTIDAAAALAERGGNSELALVYVVEVPQQFTLDADLPDAVQAGEAVIERAERYAGGTEDDAWRRISGTLLQARYAAAAVVDEAIERGADAIVIGTTNQRRYGVLTQGETVPYVLDNAPCDVIVLRLIGESVETE